MQSPIPGLEQSTVLIKTGGWMDLEQPCRGLGDIGQQKKSDKDCQHVLAG